MALLDMDSDALALVASHLCLPLSAHSLVLTCHRFADGDGRLAISTGCRIAAARLLGCRAGEVQLRLESLPYAWVLVFDADTEEEAVYSMESTDGSVDRHVVLAFEDHDDAERYALSLSDVATLSACFAPASAISRSSTRPSRPGSSATAPAHTVVTEFACPVQVSETQGPAGHVTFLAAAVAFSFARASLPRRSHPGLHKCQGPAS